MRLKTIIVITVAAGAAAFVAGGVYHHFATTPVRKAEMAPSVAPQTAPQAEGERSFSVHETPQPVAEIEFVDGSNREMTLAAFRGKTILLNIWATWCVPCREEMPALDRLQAKLGGPDFEVVPLSIDRGGLPPVKTFYEELGLTELGIYVDKSGKAGRVLGAVGIPTTLLVNREGQEIGRLVGPAEWDRPEMIALLRRQLPPATATNAN